MMLTDLAAVLRAAGLDVVEQAGWKTRGHGPMTDVQGVTCHHTASGRGTGTTLGLNTVQEGRPGLDGPLAQLYLNRAGTFYVVAAGLCYHAGISAQNDQTNSHRIGIEALAAGDGWSHDWPPVQLAAYAIGCHALATHYRFSVKEVLGHKETASDHQGDGRPSGRKTDPSFDMDVFRGMVKAVGQPAKPQEVDMTLSSADALALWTAKALPLTPTDAAVFNRTLAKGQTPFKAGDKVALSDMVRYGTLDRKNETRLIDIESKLTEVKSQAQSNGGQLSNLTTAIQNQNGVLAEILSAVRSQA
jgi:hypothetical protein